MIGLMELAERGLVRAGVERCGHSVSLLPDVEMALREIACGSIDTLIVETPVLDAQTRELLAAARQASVPALLIARDRSMSSSVEALRAGATDCLVAPFEFESLERALARLVDAGLCPKNEPPGAAPLITRDPELLATLEMVRGVSASDATVLIEGESGTGKELLARLVHRCSPRRDRELVSVNCAALPAGLLESELFGHERGAFTGAIARTIGKFELAHGATILLDEIGELELGLQAKLLRVIQEKEVTRVGAHRPVSVDFRLVATTNRDLASEARTGRFRQDLFYRLNVLPVRLKPLRERPGDVRVLLSHFFERHAEGARALPLLLPQTLAALERHSWPGNVRELENLVERLVLTRGGREVAPEQLGFTPLAGSRPRLAGDAPPFQTIREMEHWLIVQTLKHMSGNRTRAAAKLGISLRTLRNKIRDYRIDDPDTLPRSGTAQPPGGTATAGQLLPGEL